MRTPIIALTANGDEATAESVLESGMNDVLCKPFGLESLGQFLETITRGDVAAQVDVTQQSSSLTL